MAFARDLGRLDRLKAQIFCLFTFLAALRWVFEVLVAEEGLFPGGPNEIFFAVDAGKSYVREFAAGF